MIQLGFQTSEEFEIPVMIRPTTRVCHSRQGVALGEIPAPSIPTGFLKDPQRWAATPRYRFVLHKQLNQKIEAIADKYGKKSFLKILGGKNASLCILSSGVALAHTYDLLKELKLEDQIALYQVKMPYPLNVRAILEKINPYKDILVIEETDPVMEMQLARRDRVKGRMDGSIPPQGELIPDVLDECIRNFAGKTRKTRPAPAGKPRRPTLCPGCPHRAAFYAIRLTFPNGIYPSDIGCYTLGLNLGAVDTVLCMGATISQAAGFYHAYRMKGEFPPIIATIGDSTFYHAGLPPLVNAVHNGARFILVLLDNSTTAMTGNQPTPGMEVLVDGRKGKAVSMEELVKASGVKSLSVVDPYSLEQMTRALKEADKVCRAEEGGVAAIISRHPCLMGPGVEKKKRTERVEISDDCIGCRVCIDDFECPAIEADPETGLARVEQTICSACGVCIQVCPQEAIRNRELRVGS
jgi:indolepyruvate ferredoxin oxidoreductase alpha subunit